MEGRESIPISGMAYSRPARPPRTFPSLPGSLLPNSSHVICFAGLSILDPTYLRNGAQERKNVPPVVCRGRRKANVEKVEEEKFYGPLYYVMFLR